MLVELNSEERDELIGLVENYLSDTRVEVRRTHTTEFRHTLKHEQDVLERLLDKLRHVADDLI